MRELKITYSSLRRQWLVIDKTGFGNPCLGPDAYPCVFAADIHEDCQVWYAANRYKPRCILAERNTNRLQGASSARARRWIIYGLADLPGGSVTLGYAPSKAEALRLKALAEKVAPPC
jgi:hypothetical protein